MITQNLEKKIVASALKSREHFFKLREAINSQDQLTQYASTVMAMCLDYYHADSAASSVDHDWLHNKINMTFDKEDRARLYSNYVSECFAEETSAINVSNLVLESKLRLEADKLSSALIGGRHSPTEILDMMDNYRSTADLVEYGGESTEEVLSGVDIEEILHSINDPGAKAKLLPLALNEVLGGGLTPESSMILFARPEVGKTAALTTMAYGFAAQGLPGIYFGNEDPTRKMLQRLASCVAGMTLEEMTADSGKARERMLRRGWENICYVPMSPGNIKLIERHVESHGDARWIIVDQMRNMSATRADTRTNELEIVARGLRDLGKEKGLVVVSSTQAGDSASDKLYLTQSDVDGSKTGIPGACDILLGVGSNQQYESINQRSMCLCKNKETGVHSTITVKINPHTSRIEDL